ncbi:MAG TPA: phytase [Candidatus Eisenbacteria bacterium]|jgi:3-phytase
MPSQAGSHRKRVRTQAPRVVLVVTAAAILAAFGAASAGSAPQGPPTVAPDSSVFGIPESTIVRPVARIETEPVPHAGDAADTPAIWVHPTDPEKSLVLGTDKHGGLMVYDLDGSQRQLVSDRSRPNDVDVLYDFPLGGRRVDLALAGCRSKSGSGVKVWVIDPITRSLSDATAGGFMSVFGGTSPYGTCVYHSARSGKCYFFVTTDKGRVEQHRLEDAGGGMISATRVRAFEVGSICEGCVADHELGYYYLSEEPVGIWKFGAEPEDGDRRTLVAKVGEHDLTADVEGLALYSATGGRGYLIASSQGSSTFNVYDRRGDNPYVVTIEPRAGRIGVVDHTDGIAVTSCPTSRQFPYGLFVAQDGENDRKNQNFKLYGWEDIAGNRLLADTHWSPRVGTPPAPASPVADLEEPTDHSGEGGTPEARSDDGNRPPGGTLGNSWAVETQPLETETARQAPPGSVRVETGFEVEGDAHRTAYSVPLALDFAASRRVAFRLEPILYAHLLGGVRTLAAGLGDLEAAATLLGWPEGPRVPGVAVALEVKLPTARSRLIGSGRADYTGDLILSRRVEPFDLHLNLGYTMVGRPPDLDTQNVYSFTVATERSFARFDVVAEIQGHTPALADPDESDGARALALEIAGEELVGTLGARYRPTDRLVLSLGLSYDNDHAVAIHPGFGLRVR